MDTISCSGWNVKSFFNLFLASLMISVFLSLVAVDQAVISSADRPQPMQIFELVSYLQTLLQGDLDIF
jgi:hypothetical protein